MCWADKSPIRRGTLWLFVAAGWICSAGPSDLDTLMRDARMVHDVSGMRFDAGVPPRPWVLVRVSPSKRSGGATIPGAVIDGTTGKTIPGEGGPPGQTRILEEGSWMVLEALDRYDGPRHGTYAFTKPARARQQTSDPDDVYSPFTFGGILACRFDPTLRSEAAFQSPFLTPPEWEKQVRGAYRRLKESPGNWVDSPDNDILKVMSFRASTERGVIPIEGVRQGLSVSSGYVRAALIYVLLTSRRDGMEGKLQDELEQSLRGSSLRERHAIALGVFAARLFRSELYSDPLTQALAEALLTTSAQPADAYLRRTLLGN